MFGRKLFFSFGLFASITWLIFSGASAHANEAPVAVAQLSLDGVVYSSNITVTRYAPQPIHISGKESTEPDGWSNPINGVASGGKCEFNSDFNSGSPTFETTISNPESAAYCTVGTQSFSSLFNKPPGVYTFNLIRITDASGAVSNIASATVTVVASANQAPVAVAKFIVNGGAPSSVITIDPSQPASISAVASDSSDPDGWTTYGNGVSSGGKCEWNTSGIEGQTPAFTKVISNPATSGSCNFFLGTYYWGSAPTGGTYVLDMLRITDAAGAVSTIGKVTVTILGPTPTPTPTIAPSSSFPTDPGPIVPCGANTKVSFYYDKASAVRNGNVPFRILLNSRDFGNVLGNPSISEAYQLPDAPVSDASVEITPRGINTYIDGVISMGSADVVTLKFDLWCAGAVGYDYLTIVKTYTWTIPTETSCLPGAPCVVVDPCKPQADGSIPSNCPNPTPSPTPCAWFDIFCTTPTPLPSPCPEGLVCITPEPSPTPTSIIDLWDDVPPPDPTKIGNAIISAICNIFGCDTDNILKTIQGINPFLATVAIAAAIVASIPAIAINILPQLSHFFQFFGSFFSIHKRKTRWGIVVDSDLGRPISRAIVQVFDAKFHQLKETQITGADGQFGFLLPSGNYYLVASESGFIFPARKKPPTVLQKNERIYLGEEFETDEQDPDKVPHFVVPMDREAASPVAQMIFWRFAEHALALIDGVGLGFLIVGAAMNTFFLLTIPGRMNMFFEILYLVLFALKLYILLSHQKGLGTVVDDTTGSAIDLAIVRLYDAKTNRIVQTRVTNVHGKFFLLVPRGMYTAAVAKAGYKTTTIQDLKISGNTSKALALDFKLVPETAEGTGSGTVSSPTPTTVPPQVPLAPEPVVASE